MMVGGILLVDHMELRVYYMDEFSGPLKFASHLRCGLDSKGRQLGHWTSHLGVDNSSE